MSCGQGTKEYGPIPVWTKRSDAAWLFFPITDPMDTSNVKKVRTSFSLDQSTGSIEIRPAMRMSNDGVTWDSPVVVGSPTPRSQDGTTWGAAFDNIASATDTRAIVQFGIQAKNTTSTSTQDHGMAALKLDINGA